MATRIKYIGPYHFRVLRPSDFEREGAPHGVELQWERDGQHTIEVPGLVAKMLVRKFPDEFEYGTDTPIDNPDGGVPATATTDVPATDPTPAG